MIDFVNKQKSVAERKHILRTSDNGQPRSAVILGATGATGKFILSQLIISPEWNKITIIHRREVDLDEISKKSKYKFTDEQKAKVIMQKVDMEKLCSDEQMNQNIEYFKGHEDCFCVLGLFHFFIFLSLCIQYNFFCNFAYCIMLTIKNQIRYNT